MIDVNYISLFSAAISSMVIGIAWYSPTVMGSRWMKLTGMSESDMKEGAKPAMFFKSFVIALVTAYTLAYFIKLSSASDLISALGVGLWIWVGFVATSGFINTMYSKRNWQIFYIDYGYQLASILAMSAILGLLR